MAKTGILAQAKPNGSALLYRAPIDSSASVALTISNDGTGAAASVGLKQYDQKLTLDSANYFFHEGDVITTHRFELDSTIRYDAISPGASITSTSQEKRAVFAGFSPPSLTTVYVKDILVQRITLENVVGIIEVGNTLTKGAAPDDTTALVYDVIVDGDNLVVIVGPQTVNGSGSAFVDGDSLSSGGGSGLISSGGLGASTNEFAFSTTTAGGVYKTLLNSLDPLTIFDDRTYRFDLSDSSMTGRDFKISSVVNGEWGSDGLYPTEDDGTEFTGGKTTNGTPGSAGAYAQYDFSQSIVPNVLYFYDGGTGTSSNANYGGFDRNFPVSQIYTYTEIFVYNLEGTWTDLTDSFTVGGTLFTVTGQTSGKWGYVRSKNGTSLEIILGKNSSPFIATDSFKDLPFTANRSTATVSSVDVDVTDIDGVHYIFEGKSLTANTQERITSIVLGPGQSIVVNSATQNNSFSLVGFEDRSDDIVVRHYPVNV